MIRQAVAAEPDNSAYRDSLGWVYYRLGRFPEAVVELEKAAADKSPTAEVLEHLGDAYAKAGQPRQGPRRLAPRGRAPSAKTRTKRKAKEVEKKVKSKH